MRARTPAAPRSPQRIPRKPSARTRSVARAHGRNTGRVHRSAWARGLVAQRSRLARTDGRRSGGRTPAAEPNPLGVLGDVRRWLARATRSSASNCSSPASMTSPGIRLAPAGSTSPASGRSCGASAGRRCCARPPRSARRCNARCRRSGRSMRAAGQRACASRVWCWPEPTIRSRRWPKCAPYTTRSRARGSSRSKAAAMSLRLASRRRSLWRLGNFSLA